MSTDSQSILAVLQSANPNTLPDMLRKQRVDRLFQPISATITIPSGTSIDLTTLRAGTEAVVSANSPIEAGELLPPIRFLRSLRVSTGTATGPRTITDASGTASTTVAKLSEDGKTLTFEAAITVFVLVFYGASETAPTSDANTPSP